MRLFLEVAKRSFQRYLTYRASALAGLATNFFFGLMRVAVLLALYGSQANVEGYSVKDVITYTGLTQAMIAYLNLFGWFELMQSVHSGEVAGDLLRPFDLFRYWLARDAGRALVNLLLRGVTIMAIYALVFNLSYPSSLAAWLLVVLSLFLGWLVSFSYAFVVNLAAFWSPDAVGIGRFFFVIGWFFSGFLMPVRFYPEWLQTVAAWTPFPYMLNTIVEVYLGVSSGWNAVGAIAVQGVWALGLIVLGQVVLRSATRRLVVLGG